MPASLSAAIIDEAPRRGGEIPTCKKFHILRGDFSNFPIGLALASQTRQMPRGRLNQGQGCHPPLQFNGTRAVVQSLRRRGFAFAPLWVPLGHLPQTEVSLRKNIARLSDHCAD